MTERLLSQNPFRTCDDKRGARVPAGTDTPPRVRGGFASHRTRPWRPGGLCPALAATRKRSSSACGRQIIRRRLRSEPGYRTEQSSPFAAISWDSSSDSGICPSRQGPRTLYGAGEPFGLRKSLPKKPGAAARSPVRHGVLAQDGDHRGARAGSEPAAKDALRG